MLADKVVFLEIVDSLSDIRIINVDHLIEIKKKDDYFYSIRTTAKDGSSKFNIRTEEFQKIKNNIENTSEIVII